MSEESPDLLKSWVVVKPDNAEDKPLTSSVEEVEEPQEPHGDSDTDSISVISESGCSHKDDEEEIVPALANEDENKEIVEEEEDQEEKQECVTTLDSKLLVPRIENPLAEKFYYFATSAVCALLLIGFSMVVQHYFDPPVHDFEPDQPKHISPRYLKNDYSLKRKSPPKSDKFSKIIKLESDFPGEIATLTPQDNDHTIRDLKSNYKPHKNKNPDVKFNKENCDAAAKQKKTDDGVYYDKKMKALKMKEDYLNKKEKFLNEKEHDLLQKEIKLKKDKEPSHNPRREKHKHKKDDKEKKEKDKFNKKYSKESKHKDYKNYKNKDERKRFHVGHDDHFKKRNISGQWYINLHKARDNIRERERASEWVFDRARLRSMKRNKAHWYFQWMVDRARHRMK